MTIKTLHSDFTGKYMLTKDMAWLWEQTKNFHRTGIAKLPFLGESKMEHIILR